MRDESKITLRSPIPGDWGWILQKHGEVFDKEFNWDSMKLETYVAKALAEFIPKSKLPRHGTWIAEVNGVPMGSIMLDREDEFTARLRLLLVVPEGRGMGIGQKLVTESIQFARKSGYSKVMLFTTSVQTDGLKLYTKLGFKLTNKAKIDEFGPKMEGIYLELEL